MKNCKYTLSNIEISYPIEKLAPKNQILFLDIETTGLSPSYASIYLIGVGYFNNDNFICEQWFAQSLEEESTVISSFLSFLKNFSVLIHFNGNQFDLPFIKKRCEALSIPCSFHSINGIDIYKRIFPYRFFLKLSNCKQKTLEDFSGICREDEYNGGELISVYKSYCSSFAQSNPDDDALSLLLLHNHDDIEGMVNLLPILTYADLFADEITVKKVQSNSYVDVNNIKKKELLLTLSFHVSIPKPISFQANDCYFSAKENTGILKVPVYQEELKYFYEGFRNYYYLPQEDMAVHKSVAAYVDKAFREQATASTCYTRKNSSFLPQWDYVFEPFFKRDYKSKNLFFELTDELKTDRAAFSKYASHILTMMANEK